MFTRSTVRRALIGIAVLASASGSAIAQQALKYKWNKGDVLHYKAVQNKTAKTSGLGMTQDSKEDQEWVYRFEVKDVTADGVATLDMSVLSVKISAEQETGGHVSKATFDTTQPPENQYVEEPVNPNRRGPGRFEGQMKPLGAMVGEHLTVVIDSAGAVQKVEGMAKVVDKMLAKMNSPNPMVMRNLRMSMGDEAMRGNLERYFKVLPDRPVSTGDTWSTSYETMISGRMRVENNWTLSGMEDAASKLVAQVKVEVTPPKEGEEQLPVKTTLTDGKGTVEAQFDAKTGQLVKSVKDLTLPLENSMSGPGGQTMSLKNDLTVKQTFERIPAPEKTEAAPKTVGS